MSCLNGLKVITQEEWTFVVAWIMIWDMERTVLQVDSVLLQSVPLGIVDVWLASARVQYFSEELSWIEK